MTEDDLLEGWLWKGAALPPTPPGLEIAAQPQPKRVPHITELEVLDLAETAEAAATRNESLCAERTLQLRLALEAKRVVRERLAEPARDVLAGLPTLLDRISGGRMSLWHHTASRGERDAAHRVVLAQGRAPRRMPHLPSAELRAVLLVPALCKAHYLCAALVVEDNEAAVDIARAAVSVVVERLGVLGVRLRLTLIVEGRGHGLGHRVAAQYGVLLAGSLPLEWMSEVLRRHVVAELGQVEHAAVVSLGACPPERASPKPLAVVATPVDALVRAIHALACSCDLLRSGPELRGFCTDPLCGTLYSDRRLLLLARCAPLLGDDVRLSASLSCVAPTLLPETEWQALTIVLGMPAAEVPEADADTFAGMLLKVLRELAALLEVAGLDIALIHELQRWVAHRTPRPGFVPRSLAREVFGANPAELVRLTRRGDQVLAEVGRDRAGPRFAAPSLEQALCAAVVRGVVDPSTRFLVEDGLPIGKVLRLAPVLLSAYARQHTEVVAISTPNHDEDEQEIGRTEHHAKILSLRHGAAELRDFHSQGDLQWLAGCGIQGEVALEVCAIEGSTAWIVAELVRAALTSLRAGRDVLVDTGNSTHLLRKEGLRAVRAQRGIVSMLGRIHTLFRMAAIGGGRLASLLRQVERLAEGSIYVARGAQSGVVVVDQNGRVHVTELPAGPVALAVADIAAFLAASRAPLPVVWLQDLKKTQLGPVDTEVVAIELELQGSRVVGAVIDGRDLDYEGDPLDAIAQVVLSRTPLHSVARFRISRFECPPRSPVQLLRLRGALERRISHRINRFQYGLTDRTQVSAFLRR